MLFTYREFQQTKNQIYEEFQKKPAIDIDCYGWDEGFNEYRKILNHLKFGKNNKSRICQSATRFRNNCERISINSRITDKNQQNQFSTNFYLTEATNTQDHLIDEKASEAEQNSELLDVIINLSQSGEVNRKLQGEIRELQNSIRFFRKQNSELQWKLNQQQKREKIASNLLLKKKNQLNTIDHKNSEIKQKLHYTERFFGRSLKSIKYSVKNNENKANEMIEEVAQRLLTFKKLNEKIKKQEAQLAILSQKMFEKQQTVSQIKILVKSSKSFVWAAQVCNYIKKSGYGKTQGLKTLLETLNSNTTNTNSDQQYAANFLKQTKQFLKIFKKMRSDGDKLKQIFESKMNEQKQLKEDLQKIISSNNKYIDNQDCNSNLVLADYHQQRQLYAQKQQERKIKRFADMVICIEERSKFFIKKQLKLLMLIVENWLKYDQSAYLFVNQTIDSFVGVLNSQANNYSSEELKIDLKQYFQNWEKYLFFYEEVLKSPLIFRNLNKRKIFILFQRIIKTKTHQPHIQTSRLFFVALNQLFCDNLSTISNNISMLWEIYQKIVSYACKYQVLIVNSMDSSIKFLRPNKQKTRILIHNRRIKQQAQQQDERIQNFLNTHQQAKNQEIQCSQDLKYPEIINIILDYQQQLNKISKLNKIKRPKTHNNSLNRPLNI